MYQMAFRDERTLSVKQIKATVERFETQCETIRINAEQGKIGFHVPQTLVLQEYLRCRDELAHYTLFLDNLSDETRRKKVFNILLSTLTAARANMEEIEKKYSKRVKFRPLGQPDNRSSYDGQRYPKVVTPFKFERVPLADSDFVEEHRRENPCNCTLL